MNTRRTLALLVACFAALAAAVLGPDPAYAAKKTYENAKLGFKLKIDDSFTLSPPKLTTDSAFIVSDWYQDAAKYQDGNLKPTFRVLWFVTPKEQPGAAEAPAEPASFDPDDPQAFMKAMREQMKSHSVDEYLDDYFTWNTHLYGEAVPMKDRWAAASKDHTAAKADFQWVEINVPTKKNKKELPHAYAYIARLTLDRPSETIEVGFVGSCPVVHIKDFQRDFMASVKSFEEMKNATDSRNEGANQELSSDRETRYKQIVEQKVVKGWKADRTDNYILLYHEDVDSKLVKQIGTQIEAIRAQVYEVLFPADKPVTAFSVVRVCKDREQYMGYGAPGGSAGYWDSGSEELVFYEDQSNKKDSLRVLYHEAFHQYIFYSVGDFAPHSWFNEGHGDYFAGFNYSAGRFTRDVFQWRIGPAKEWKRLPNRPHLKDWVTWSQREYYGSNALGIDGGLNYAAGWSLVYFLRTTKKPEYQGILERYFNSLKGSVTRAREAQEARRAKLKEWEEKIKEWEEKVKEDPSIPRPERPDEDLSGTSDIGSRDVWLQTAVTEAFQGIDWDALEKDWLAADY